MSAAAPSRRLVLRSGLGLLGAGALAACGGHPRTTAAPTGPAVGRSVDTVDAVAAALQLTVLGAALENLAAASYAALRSRAADGAYGAVPVAVAAYVQDAADHHREHAAAWNALLGHGGHAAVDGVPLTSAPARLDAVRTAPHLETALTLVAMLEVTAAATYLQAAGGTVDAASLALATTIAPVEAGHATVLALLTRGTAVPASFFPTTGALGVGELTIRP